MHSGASIGSLESGMRNVLDENELERAMADIDKAKARSRQQRIRSFCNAAAQGNEEWLGRLLKSGIKVNDADANGRTALMLATCAGHLSVSIRAIHPKWPPLSHILLLPSTSLQQFNTDLCSYIYIGGQEPC